MDFLITESDVESIVSTSNETEPTSSVAATSSNYVVYKKGMALMVIEVKTSVAADFVKLTSSDVIELLIYCQYLTRLEKMKLYLVH